MRSPLALVAADAEWTVALDGESVTAEFTHGSELARLVGPAAPTGRVEMTLGWPALDGVDADGELKLALDVSIDHGVVVGVIDHDALDATQDRMLQMLSDAASDTAARRERDPGVLLGSTAVPDAAMARLWSPLFAALRAEGAAEGLLRLVHARHSLRIEPTAAVETRSTPFAEVCGHDRVTGGRRIHTRAGDGRVVVSDEFLVRDGAGVAQR